MRIHDLLSPDEIPLVKERSRWRGLWLVAHAWGVILLTMLAVALLPLPAALLFFPLAVMIIGTRQLGLAILMHDAAHKAIHPNPSINERVSDFFCAFPTLARTDSYRRYHLKHHAHTQQDEDPDLVLSAPFPITRKSLKRKIIRDLTGQTGFAQRKAQILDAVGTAAAPDRTRRFFRKLGGPLAAQTAIFALLAASGYWHFYFTLWLVPLLTWHQLVTRIRNIAEHAVVPDNDDPLRNTRTTRTGWMERAFIAPYWVNYHIEHHLLMWVPCYRLPRFHRLLAQKRLTGQMEITQSYADMLKRAASRPDNEDRPGRFAHHQRRSAAPPQTKAA